MQGLWGVRGALGAGQAPRGGEPKFTLASLCGHSLWCAALPPPASGVQEKDPLLPRMRTRSKTRADGGRPSEKKVPRTRVSNTIRPTIREKHNSADHPRQRYLGPVYLVRQFGRPSEAIASQLSRMSQNSRLSQGISFPAGYTVLSKIVLVNVSSLALPPSFW